MEALSTRLGTKVEFVPFKEWRQALDCLSTGENSIIFRRLKILYSNGDHAFADGSCDGWFLVLKHCFGCLNAIHDTNDAVLRLCCFSYAVFFFSFLFFSFLFFALLFIFIEECAFFH